MLEDANSSTAIYYISTNVGLSLKQKFLETASAKLVLGYTDNDYNNQNGAKHQVDDIFSTEIALDNTYRKLLSYGVSYKYYAKSSTISNQTYGASVFSAHFKFFY